MSTVRARAQQPVESEHEDEAEEAVKAEQEETEVEEESDADDDDQEDDEEVQEESDEEPASTNAGQYRYAPQDGRRPWSNQETQSFTKALKRTVCVAGALKRPYVTILALHGKEGFLNEKLKDRNSLQLKDKARNIAILKTRSGEFIPYWKKYLCPAAFVSIPRSMTCPGAWG